MVPRNGLVVLALLSVALAGCTGTPGGQGTTEGLPPAESTATPTASEPVSSTPTPVSTTPTASDSVPGTTTAESTTPTPTPTETPPDSNPDEARVEVEGKSLPVDADTVLRRVETLTGTSIEAPTVEVRTGRLPIPNPVEGETVPEVFGLDGWDPGNGTSGRAIPSVGMVEIYPQNGTEAEIEHVLAHEFVHIVQFQSDIDAESLALQANSTDGQQAYAAMVEGSAVYVSDRYIDRYLNTSRTQFDIMADAYRQAPPGERFFRSRYLFGARYLRATLDSPRNLSGAFRKAPLETETLIHNRSDGPQPPLDVSFDGQDDRGDFIDQSAWNDTKGELVVRNVLRSELPRSRAAPGAAGWGTDRFFTVSDTGESGFGTVWALRWENASEADEFAMAFRAYADRHSPTSEYEYRLARIDSATTVVFAGTPSFVTTATASGTNSAVTVSLPESG